MALQREHQSPLNLRPTAGDDAKVTKQQFAKMFDLQVEVEDGVTMTELLKIGHTLLKEEWAAHQA